MRRHTMKMRRSLLALGTSAALLSLAGGNALACGTSCTPSTNSVSQSSSNSQILPLSIGLGVSAPINLSAPVGVLSPGANQGSVTQKNSSTSTAKAVNAEVSQDASQNGNGGNNSASQSSSNSQILPIAIGASISAPINLNLPIAVLSPGANKGDVDQRNDSTASSRAANVEHDQSVNQWGGKNGNNSASQSAANTQILPIALGLGISAPINVNAPIAVLSPGANKGDVKQRNDSDARAEALNNETEQSVIQKGGAHGGSNTASQSAVSSQLLPIAVALAAAAPINANAPIAVLSPHANQGNVNQQGDADVFTEALNYELDQNAKQDGANGGTNSSSQSASNSQILPVAAGVGIGLPINANAPIAALAPGANKGDVKQRTNGDADVSAINNRTRQDVNQRGGSTNSATQSAVSSQLLALAPALGAAAPVNANAPIDVLTFFHHNDNGYGDVNQESKTTVTAESINADVSQNARQDGPASNHGPAATSAQPLPVAPATSAPADVNMPIPVLSSLGSLLHNPFGLLRLLGGL